MKCVHCHTTFPTSDELDGHLESVHKGSANKVARCCISCGKVTSELDKHVQEAHGLAVPSFPCRVCSQPFMEAGKRNRHEWKDHNDVECVAYGLVRLA